MSGDVAPIDLTEWDAALVAEAAANRWHIKLLGLADFVRYWSKDPSTKVGAVIARPDNTIASVGYNGLPRGVHDDPKLIHDRPWKYARTVHAEINAILSAREPVRGYTLYVTPLHPCSACAAVIVQAGIARVVTSDDALSEPRWAESFAAAGDMFRQAKVEVIFR